jgi:hypothetical protein
MAEDGLQGPKIILILSSEIIFLEIMYIIVSFFAAVLKNVCPEMAATQTHISQYLRGLHA